jgi:hypothetical protein
MEQGDRSQNPEFRRKAIKSDFFSTTGYGLLDTGYFDCRF